MKTAISVSLLLAAAVAISGVVLVGGTATSLTGDEEIDDKNKSVYRNRSSNINKINKNLRHLKSAKEKSVVGPRGSCIFDVPTKRRDVKPKKDDGKNKSKNNKEKSPSYRFDSMVAFGDSFTDGGTRAYFPPCLNNNFVFCNNPRVGDGPLFADYLAAYFNVAPLEVGFTGLPAIKTPPGGSNFARSGAYGRNLNSLFGDSTPSTGHFSDQIENYKAAIGLNTVPGFKGNLDLPTKRRLHLVWFGSNDNIFALLLRIRGASDAAQKAVLAAGVAGIKEQFQELYEMDNVCNVLVLGAHDGSRVQAGVLLDPAYKGLNILNTALEYNVQFNKDLDTMIATDFKEKFHKKCRGNDRGFGIQFVDAVDIMKEAFPLKKYPREAPSCNRRNRTSKNECDKAAGQFLSLVPTSNRTESDGLCTNPVYPGKTCDCSGLLLYDELQMSGEFHKKFFQQVVKSLDL
ncbi:hypothetical protein ACA910_007397 [Epithemia clementina (nom. ined.)]